MVDSGNVKIRYSLRPMTSLWRIIISYLTYVNKNTTVSLMNWNAITYAQNIHLSL